jgi:hypothetical protein
VQVVPVKPLPAVQVWQVEPSVQEAQPEGQELQATEAETKKVAPVQDWQALVPPVE